MYKVTREQLEEGVQKGFIRKMTLEVEGTPYVYDVYSEWDVALAISNRKFAKKLNPDGFW